MRVPPKGIHDVPPKEIHDVVLVESSDTVNLWSMLVVIWHIPLIRAVFLPLRDLAQNTSKAIVRP
jgi:hypothetical protein